MARVGLQLFSVWKDAEKDFLNTIERVADLGYESIQFAGFYDTPIEDVADLMERKGITAAGAHVPIEQLQGEALDRVLFEHEKLGNQLIICPALPKHMRDSEDAWRKSAELFNDIGQRCKEEGFTFGYHNHDFEFEEVNGQTGFELIFKNTDPDIVKMELDCYWASYSGVDPYSIITEYKDRCLSLHVKDIKTVGEKTVSTEISKGELPLQQLIEEAMKHGTEWFIVEQEDFEGDPYESLGVSASNLSDLAAKARSNVN
ncbi:sugar phosphate isomerase/epimerase [Scopulibacillus darangshiensis]|uniref:Sugar phosphate isomerase/epimerase n=1 Tax=Scopulibacillus darangshiensis TaxID=442528 RepID=A0A4V2SN27_9BACL|nr:sugar phosphate isomerase/epimerase [Scopulibacillus darangshiensis]TCP29476.1 sugar phosphate isomerase/epimerase [Scopulibacillus darangshiensis]